MTRFRRRPWWIPHFLGRVPGELEDSHVRLLGAVALALLLEEYDLAMLTAALKFIVADLGMQESQFGNYLGIIRLGAIPAFFLIPFADRIGRRRVFLASVGLTGLFTFATAFSQTPAQFVLLQALTRTFFVSGSTMAFVIVTEEFPAAHRGWGIGMLGALGATGHGLGAALFSQIDRLPYGWRSLYAFGIVGVVLIPFLRKRVPETQRFTSSRTPESAGEPAGAWWTPLRDLAMTHPGRAFGIALTGLLPGFGIVAAFQFTGYFTQTVHGWTPGEYSLMVIVGGAIGIVGHIVAGNLGDRIGRRSVGFALLALNPVFVGAFYLGPGWAIPIAWIGLVFTSSGGRMILRALSTELFPTAHRGSASGMYAVIDTVGAAAGLFVLSAGTYQPGELVTTIPLISLMVAVGGSVLLFFPETRQRELEAINQAPEVAG
jgi:putative MFS transporter